MTVLTIQMDLTIQTVLTIQSNPLISETPTFPEYSNLKKLTICGLISLREIDCSIGKLRWLTDLSFENCQSIEKLPEQIGELQNLQCLCLKCCSSLIELPTSVSKIKLLTELDVSHTKIAEMPSTMSKFRQLQTLDLEDCHEIQELPKLPISLTILRLRSGSLQTVPNLSYLTNLVQLLLSGSGLNGTPSKKIANWRLEVDREFNQIEQPARLLYKCPHANYRVRFPFSAKRTYSTGTRLANFQTPPVKFDSFRAIRNWRETSTPRWASSIGKGDSIPSNKFGKIERKQAVRAT